MSSTPQTLRFLLFASSFCDASVYAESYRTQVLLQEIKAACFLCAAVLYAAETAASVSVDGLL